MQKTIIIFLFVITVSLLRYDFTYNQLPYKVQPSDTLWSILDSKVFHNSAITGLSIEFLKSTNPQVDWDYLQAHKIADDGYTLSVFMGRLNIRAPNKQYVVRSVALLPQSALWNHFVQVILHDIVILSMAVFIYTAFLENEFRISKNLVTTLVIAPLFLALLIPACLILFSWLFHIIYTIVSPQNLMIINR